MSFAAFNCALLGESILHGGSLHSNSLTFDNVVIIIILPPSLVNVVW